MLAGAGVDLVTVFTTVSAVPEAIGNVRAAVSEKVPVVVSSTVETDVQLPGGQPLGEAIEQVDSESDAAASFMVNCVHPSHLAPALQQDGRWRERIGGPRVNASRKSHADLDAAESLDDGDPQKLRINKHSEPRAGSKPSRASRLSIQRHRGIPPPWNHPWVQSHGLLALVCLGCPQQHHSQRDRQIPQS